MRFVVLGPVQVSVDGKPVPIDRAQRRAVVAYLTLNANRTVSVGQLIEALWGGAEPATAKTQVFAAMSAIRRTLRAAGRDPIASTTGGYVLSLAPKELDLAEFRELVEQARGLEAALAVATLRKALGLFQGAPLSGISGAFVDAASALLDEQRLSAQEQLFDLELGLGRGQGIIGELSALVNAYPQRERFVGQLMLALYRSGRQAEALSVYRACRSRLIAELGLEPTGELQQLHQEILIGQTPATAEVTLPRLNFLPRDLPDFVGREADMDWLDSVFQVSDSVAMISALTGTAGVGKTALAVRWAHRVAERFPDGQLYINLRGYDQGRSLREIDALSYLLRCLGVPAESLPTNVEDATARFRSAVVGKRMLILLDNAHNAKLVRALLPGEQRCLVLVTSRDMLSGLIAFDGAKRRTLDLLSDGEAIDLLRRLVGADRLAAEPAAAEQLVRRCARLPLALRIAAAHLADRPRESIADYVDGLSGRQGVNTLVIEGDEDRAVSAVLDQSYIALSTSDQRVLRLLGAYPGPDFGSLAIAALADLTHDEAVGALERLISAHLVAEHRPGRFSSHDLIRDYAGTKAAQDSTADEALTRLLEYYRDSAVFANSLISSTPVDQSLHGLPVLTSISDAMHWLDSERANLVESISVAAARGWTQLACDLAQPLWLYFHHAGHTGAWIATFETVLAQSDATIDEGTRAYLANALGGAYLKAGRYDEAIRIHEDCISIRQRLGDFDGLARSRANLALSYEHQGRYDEALVQVKLAMAVCRESGNRAFELQLLTGSLVAIYINTGQFALAREILLEELPAIRQYGSVHDVGRALANLGEACRRLGQPKEALPYLQEALSLDGQIADRNSEGVGLCAVGYVYRDLGEHAKAIDLIEHGVEIIREAGTRAEVSDALNELAATYLAADETQRARATFEENVELSQQIGARHFQARARAGLAGLIAEAEPDSAKRHYVAALTILDEVNPGEAEQLRQRLSAVFA